MQVKNPVYGEVKRRWCFLICVFVHIMSGFIRFVL
jgi:hypothetical protein